uniref:Uncharacterized protein n=1 Tax=Neogobius melanostomus TaxID=47308 RepID=A0A8C6V1E8_9GOBI
AERRGRAPYLLLNQNCLIHFICSVSFHLVCVGSPAVLSARRSTAFSVLSSVPLYTDYVVWCLSLFTFKNIKNSVHSRQLSLT